GAKLVTIASTDDVKIKIQISKSDMSKIKEGQEVDITINGNSYTGTVSKVSGTAQNNSSGVPIVNAEIKVSNPDDNIILGVEASNKIHTDSASDVIVLPYEYVNTDTEGDFVYVVENGVLTRRDVTVGVTSGTQAEITEGLTTEDKIVVSDTDEIEIGQNVTTVDVTE
nr:HlyD family efflux transporter periplasmic adaptor subunit [Butyrivibrio sp.]